jgi:hypothetical protein
VGKGVKGREKIDRSATGAPAKLSEMKEPSPDRDQSQQHE